MLNVKKCQSGNIAMLASLGDGDVEKAASLYRRCVRYCLRYFRWGEAAHSKHTNWDDHEHEGELLRNLGKRLDEELGEYGLEWEYPGLYPVIVKHDGEMGPELVWY